MKMMALAIRTMAGGEISVTEQQDLVAFLALALKQIRESVDQTAIAWEKRDYWVKADHFRMEWRWVDRLESGLLSGLQSEDWSKTLPLIAELAGKLSNVELPKRPPSIPAWSGAWNKWKAMAVPEKASQ